jgi:hypothetical protein
MNKHTNWHYLVLSIGLIFCLLAVFFLFTGIKSLVDNLFNESKNESKNEK